MSVALNFQQTGNLDAPAVVLLGSLGSDLSMWQPQIHALSNRYRVIAVNTSTPRLSRVWRSSS